MAKNYLVLSDLHIGEGLKVFADGIVSKPSEKTTTNLTRFFEHYTTTKPADGDWVLVINGDMIDFMSMFIEGNPGILPNEENIYGLGTDEANTRIKLDHVIKAYPELFAALAKFAVYNKVEIITGNHDLELAYQSIQEQFVDSLCKLIDRNISYNITFHRWFYYDPEFIYAEHGAQYDEFCSIDHLFAPLEEKIVPSLAHVGVKYYTNKVPHYDTKVAEKWGFFDHAKWSYKIGLRKAITSIYHYAILVMKTIIVWYKLRKNDKQRKKFNEREILRCSQETGIDINVLTRLYNLRRPPVSRNLFRILGTYFIDRMLLGIIGITSIVIFSTSFHHHWKIIAPLASVAVLWGLNVAFNKIRFGAPSEKTLRAAARVIRVLMPAKYITFGHVHEPEIGLIDEHSTYINTGSWTEKNRYTYAVITDDRYQLRYWYGE